jgi:hypothetical protein
MRKSEFSAAHGYELTRQADGSVEIRGKALTVCAPLAWWVVAPAPVAPVEPAKAEPAKAKPKGGAR